MKRVIMNEHSVDLTEESLNSFIKSKFNACDREVKYAHRIRKKGHSILGITLTNLDTGS